MLRGFSEQWLRKNLVKLARTLYDYKTWKNPWKYITGPKELLDMRCVPPTSSQIGVWILSHFVQFYLVNTELQLRISQIVNSSGRTDGRTAGRTDEHFFGDERTDMKMKRKKRSGTLYKPSGGNISLLLITFFYSCSFIGLSPYNISFRSLATSIVFLRFFS